MTLEAIEKELADIERHRCKHGHPYACGLCDAEKAPKCKHGNPDYCGLCENENAPKCKHGHHNYCGFCGVVTESKPKE